MPPSTQAGPSTSTAASTISSLRESRKSPYEPYAVLPPSTKRKLDPKDALTHKSYLAELSISNDAADERVAGKFLQLDLPEGKVSDQRKAELANRELEKEKKRSKRLREGDCGLVGKRKRATRGKTAVKSVNYAAVLPVYHLWLGYMAELLALPIAIPSSSPSSDVETPLYTSASVLPTYLTRNDPAAALAKDANVNVVNVQTKLVKAEFVGCMLSIKRAKNPSLVGLSGIVLQETQGTFKIVTPTSLIKILPKQGSVFTLVFPLQPAPSALPASPSSSSRELRLELYGDAFAYRSADRVGRKWKAGTSAGGVELV